MAQNYEKKRFCSGRKLAGPTAGQVAFLRKVFRMAVVLREQRSEGLGQSQLLSNPSENALLVGTKDIKTFIAEKDPKKDVQVAAVVAYYYRFEAPPAERKDAINKEDLQEAMRLAGRPP